MDKYTKDYIHQFYPREEATADDLVRQYGSVAAALEDMRSLGLLRLYKLICKYYPDESANYIKSVDDGYIIWEIDIPSVIPLYYFDGSWHHIGIELDSIKSRLERAISADDVKQYIEIADDWIMVDFINSLIIDYDAINIARYLKEKGILLWVEDGLERDDELPHDIDSFRNLALHADELFDEDSVFSILTEAIERYPMYQDIVMHYANKGEEQRKVVLEQALNNKNEQLMRDLRFSRNDDIELIFSHEPVRNTHDWYSFIDYLLQVNPSLRRPLQLLAFENGADGVLQYLGFEFFDFAKTVDTYMSLYYAIDRLLDFHNYDGIKRLVRTGIENNVLNDEKIYRIANDVKRHVERHGSSLMRELYTRDPVAALVSFD